MTKADAPSDVRGWIPDLATFGERLALVRHRMGWNVKEAAVECGLPPQSWRNWESGKQPHDVVAVCRQVSLRTGVSFDWLLLGVSSREVCSYFGSDSPDMPGALVAA